MAIISSGLMLPMLLAQSETFWDVTNRRNDMAAAAAAD
jgi:hypothetical protein